ncbi:DUF4401 domain-containing protein [Myroides sp. LJL110]
MNLKSTTNSLVEKLQNQGVVINKDAYEKQLENQGIKSSLINIVTIVAGLLACGFFLLFISLALRDLLDYLLTFLILGGGFLTVAYFINKRNDQAISQSMGVSLFITGFLLITIGIALHVKYSQIHTILAFVIIGLCLISIVFYRQPIILFLTICGLYVGLYMLVFNNLGIKSTLALEFLMVLGVVILSYPRTMARIFVSKLSFLYYPFYKASLYGSLAIAIWFRSDWFLNSQNPSDLIFLDIVVYGLIALNFWSILILFKSKHITSKFILIALLLTTSLFIFLVGRVYTGFAISYLYILWSFNQKDKVDLVLSGVFLIITLVLYYYNLQVNLLQKSISLFISGVIFMGLFILFQKTNYENKQNKVTSNTN